MIIRFFQEVKQAAILNVKVDLIKKINLQLFAQMPSKEAQIKHIMSERKGHIIDTPENRSLLESASSNEKNYVGKDSHGNTRYAKIINGKQVWVSVRNGII